MSRKPNNTSKLPRTGWPAGLLQADDKTLSKWFSSRLGARRVVDDVCTDLRTKEKK